MQRSLHNETVTAITAFQLTTAEPDRLTRFYAAGLGFSFVGREAIPTRDMELFGLPKGGERTVLDLGGQALHIDCFEHKGRPYPERSTATDMWFQHFAVVTDNAAASWARVHAEGAAPISIGPPVTLPVSSGLVTAIKFRDPDGHPLELLQFPSASSRWRGRGNMGIDHSAISVSDARASQRFYEQWGLVAQHANFNHGPEQARLDGLIMAEADVVPMVPRMDAPHLELLGYRIPRGAALTEPLQANDIVATRIVWSADACILVRDPDGHLQVLKDY